MPNIGEIKRGLDIGYYTDAKYIWVACAECGKERWVHLVKNKPQTRLCQKCSGVISGLANRGTNNPAWKGGRNKFLGYIRIKLYSDDFFYPMAKQDGYVMEHRLVMAKQLGRNLHPWEIIHHLNGIKDDNRLENLQLISIDKHNQMTIMLRRIEKLEQKVDDQMKQIRLLQWQMKENSLTQVR